MHTIVLAAGMSKRMDGRQKLVLPWGTGTVIGHTVHEALCAMDGTGSVVVVTGCDEEPVTDALMPLVHRQSKGLYGNTQLLFAHNAQYELGQFSSTLTGLWAIGDEPFFITLGDLPLVSATHYRALAPLLKGYDAVRPMCDGMFGHPVLHAAHLRREILALPPEKGQSMRNILTHKNTYAPDDGDIAWISDIDTPQAYEALKALAGM